MLGARAGDLIGSEHEDRLIETTDFPLFHISTSARHTHDAQ
ncbi:MAG: hypothetical protein V1792_26305 [Pseudomonadota bacterium]